MTSHSALPTPHLMSILDKVNSSADVKKLNSDELVPYCDELREFIVKSVANTGGHLASSLGAVELIVALHRVYDTAKDRIVFDVGHQSYAHKIITGRRDVFSTLRQFGGIAGFPKPSESADDAFIAGHASDSVSVALGMARARTMQHMDYDVAAVIGDGALTGGLAYEGLSNVAGSGEPMVIILNDNNMSISENVGGVANSLQQMRLKPGYIDFKRWYKSVFTRLPELYSFNHKIKEWLKSRLLPENMFSEMGLYYLGPVDGHNVKKLERVISWARELKRPVVVHVVTRKGKGCSYAEEWPERYHGVGQFDYETGIVKKKETECFSSRFGEYLSEFAEKDDRICAISAAMICGTGLEEFGKKYPERLFDVGIAEGHAVSMAAGLAKQGAIPVFAVYSTFLQRSYDMLIHDVALQHLHVVLAVDRAGLVGNDGETHHGVFDVSYLSSVPGMTVLCPASYGELRAMLKKALFELDGPVAIRYPRGCEQEYSEVCLEDAVIKEGSDITIVSYGCMINKALSSGKILEQQGISPEIVKLASVCPNDFSVVLTSLQKTRRLIVLEDVCSSGCAGEAILARTGSSGICLKKAKLINLGDGIVTHGTTEQLFADCGLDSNCVAECAANMIKSEQ